MIIKLSSPSLDISSCCKAIRRDIIVSSRSNDLHPLSNCSETCQLDTLPLHQYFFWIISLCQLGMDSILLSVKLLKNYSKFNATCVSVFNPISNWESINYFIEIVSLILLIIIVIVSHLVVSRLIQSFWSSSDYFCNFVLILYEIIHLH